MGFIGNLLVKLGLDTTDFNTGTDKATRSVQKFGQDLSAAGQKLTVGLSLPMIAFAATAVKSAGDMEALTKGLDSITKNSAETARQLGRLQEVAKLPGLGFREAVQGSINLQSAGFSANLAEKSLKAFGNALATVGKGKAELDGVILALTQIQAKGKVSAEEINQLQERLPQIRAAMKAAFGTADTEALQKLGIGAQEFIEKITNEFLKLPPVVGGLNNSFENARDAAEQALAKIGGILAPFVSDFLNNWFSPMIDRVKVFAEEFKKLPQPMQNVALGAGALAATLPLITVALGSMISNSIIIAGAFGKLVGIVSTLAVALGTQLATALGSSVASMTALSAAGAAAAATLAVLLIPAVWKLVEARNAYKDAERGAAEATELQGKSLAQLENHLRKNGAAIDAMQARYKAGAITYTEYMRYLRDVGIELGKTAKAHQDHAAAVITGEKALAILGIKSTADRKRDLENARAAYDALKAAGSENGIVLAEAANKVKAAQEALNGVTVKTKEHIAAIPFGQKGIEAAVLVEQIKLLNAEQQKFIADVAKAGGMDAFKANAARHVQEAMDALSNPPAIEGIGKMSDALHDLLNPVAKLPPELQDTADALKAFGLAGKNADISELERQFDVLTGAFDENRVSAEQLDRAWIRLMHAKDAAGEFVSVEDRTKVLELEKRYGGQIKETAKQIRENEKITAQFQREVSRAWDGLTRGIARNIVEWKSWGDTLKNIGKDLAASFLEIMIKGLFNKLKDQFADLLKHAGGVFAKIGGWLGGGASGAAGAAANAAGNAAGAAGQAGGGIAGAVGGLTGALTAIGSIGSMVTGVIGLFQGQGMNKSLDVLVNHTLRMFNVLAQMLDEHYLFKGQLFAKLDDMWRTGLEIKDILGRGIATTGTGKGPVTISISNCTIYGTTPSEIARAIFDELSLAGGVRITG